MTLDELLRIIDDASTDEWVKLTPIRVDQIKVYGGDIEVAIEGHEYIAHYRPDLDIAIAWGAPQGEHEGVWSSWSRFSDRRVSGQYVDILWRGRPVIREEVVTADGGRYLLPSPSPDFTDDPTADPTRWTVSASAIPLARLLHSLGAGAGHDFDRGLRTSGFEIIDE